MSQVKGPAKKLIIHDKVEEFGRLTFEQAEAKKIVIRNLKGLVHKVVHVSRKNLLRNATYTSSPLGMIQPGLVAERRFGDTEWSYRDIQYNECRYGEDFPALVGMVIGYEVIERDSGGSVYLIVAAPNDRFEYRFEIAFSEIEVLDGFPAD